MYVNEEGEDGEVGNVLNYLIKCNEKNLLNKFFLNIIDGFFGKKFIVDVLGVKVLFYKDGKIYLKDGRIRLEF